jgi:hypothetical protein
MAMESVTGLKLALKDALLLSAIQVESRDIEFLSKAIFSPNGQEGLRSVLEKRRPIWKYIKVSHNNMEKRIIGSIHANLFFNYFFYPFRLYIDSIIQRTSQSNSMYSNFVIRANNFF